MPEVGGGESKADVFYSTIRKFNNATWNAFARQQLELPENVIDDIQNDHHRSAQEQKYQMLLYWEQIKGSLATKEKLKSLVQKHFAMPGNEGSQQASQNRASQQAADVLVPRGARPISPVPQVQVEHLSYRQLLQDISNNLTQQNFTDIQDLFSHVTRGQNFQNTRELLLYLDNNNLWGATTVQGKVSVLRCIIRNPNATNIINDWLQANYPGQQQPIGQQGTSAITTHASGSSGGQPNRSAPNNEVTSHETMPKQGISGNTNLKQVYSPGNQQTNNSVQTQGQSQAAFGEPSNPSYGGKFKVTNLHIHMAPNSKAFDIHSLEPISAGMTNPPQIIPREAIQSQVNTRMEASVADICKFEGEVVVEPSRQQDFDRHIYDNEIYPIKNQPKGHVLILSNTEFTLWPEHERKGGKRDLELMTKLWSGLGCKVISRENRTKQVMETLLKNFAQQKYHRSSDLCVVIIMSHGNYDAATKESLFYGTDGVPMKAEDAIRFFDNDNCPGLHRTPKIFLFQFCRGVSADRGVDASDSIVEGLHSLKSFQQDRDETDTVPTKKIPTRTDVHVTFSSLEGKISFRDQECGSWFLNAVANVFMRNAKNTHVADMLTKVKNGLVQRTSNTPNNPETHGCKEMAESRDFLTKKLFLFPGFPIATDDPELME